MKPGKARAAPEVKRCAIYTRKSTSAGLEMDFNSLDAQYEACANFIRLNPAWRLVEQRYDDGGFTGANIDRPAFQRLLMDIEEDKIDIVIVHRVDRLSRSLLDFAKLMELLNEAGASFVSVTQNFSTADAMGRLTLNMLMSFAEFEREMIAARTRDKVTAARRKGKWTGGHTPFGYDLRDKRLVVNDLEARIVREAFDLLQQHRSAAVVARILNSRTLWPRGSKAPNGKSPRWNNDSIARVLRCPLYAGFMTVGEELHQGEHPALVPPETFHRVQAILNGVHRDTVSHGLNHDYVLRGLLRCGRCGAAMTSASTRKGDTQYRYYRCSARNKGGAEACKASPISAVAIEEHVAQHIASAVTDDELVFETTEAISEKIIKKRETLTMVCSRLPAKIASLSAATSKLVDELARSDGPARAAVDAKLRVEAEKLDAVQRQLATAEQELAILAGVETDAKWVASSLENFAAVWDSLTTTNRGRLLRALIERVVVNESSGQVEIHLTDLDGTEPGPTQEAA